MSEIYEARLAVARMIVNFGGDGPTAREILDLALAAEAISKCDSGAPAAKVAAAPASPPRNAPAAAPAAVEKSDAKADDDPFANHAVERPRQVAEAPASAPESTRAARTAELLRQVAALKRGG